MFLFDQQGDALAQFFHFSRGLFGAQFGRARDHGVKTVDALDKVLEQFFTLFAPHHLDILEHLDQGRACALPVALRLGSFIIDDDDIGQAQELAELDLAGEAEIFLQLFDQAVIGVGHGLVEHQLLHVGALAGQADGDIDTAAREALADQILDLGLVIGQHPRNAQREIEKAVVDRTDLHEHFDVTDLVRGAAETGHA